MPNISQDEKSRISDEFYQSLFTHALHLVTEARNEFRGCKDKAGLISSVLRSRQPDAGLEPVATGVLLQLLDREGEAEGNDDLRALVLGEARRVRGDLYGNDVAMMVPIEISSYCASNCTFCGWRSDNKDMVRLKISEKALNEQLQYLAGYNFSHFELVAGDDLVFIKNELTDVVRSVKAQLKERNPEARVSICLTPLHEIHYQTLKAEGLDTVLTWQETYNPELYKKLITSGPKAHGMTHDFKVAREDGCTVRMKSHELAVRANLQVGLGVMVGLEEDHPDADILAAILHGAKLIEHYPDTMQPIIIGMPTWNPITTARTDNAKFHRTRINPERDFELVAAIYFLGLPNRYAWVFPNCRVSKATQINAIKTAGCFTSGMVRVGPGAYLDYSNKEDASKCFSKCSEPLDTLTKERILNGEQFTHHFDTQENYVMRFKEAGLNVVLETKYLSELAATREKRLKKKAA